MAHIVFKAMMGTQNASSLHFRDRSEVAQTRPVGHFRLPICLRVAHESPQMVFIFSRNPVCMRMCVLCAHILCVCVPMCVQVEARGRRMARSITL